jgi:hypothetical protein
MLQIAKKGKSKGKEVNYFNCNYCDKGFQGPSSTAFLEHLRKTLRLRLRNV